MKPTPDVPSLPRRGRVQDPQKGLAQKGSSSSSGNEDTAPRRHQVGIMDVCKDVGRVSVRISLHPLRALKSASSDRSRPFSIVPFVPTTNDGS